MFRQILFDEYFNNIDKFDRLLSKGEIKKLTNFTNSIGFEPYYDDRKDIFKISNSLSEIEIIIYNDDYYLISYHIKGSLSSENKYYSCDQINGVIYCIKHLLK